MEPSKMTGPSNLYYDHQNNKQTHASPSGLQTKQGIIPLTNTQDVRYMDAISIDNTAEKQEDIALVILKSGRLTGRILESRFLTNKLLKRWKMNMTSF